VEVPDTATQALMTRFHRNVWQKKGAVPMSKLEALREAQLWLLRGQPRNPDLLRGSLQRVAPPNFGEPIFPFYGAACVLSGDLR